VPLDRVTHPIVLAPMAGGPSTPELAAAVDAGGGVGFLATGYLPVETVREQLERLRALTDGPFGVNLFVPGEPSDPGAYAAYVEHLRQAGLELGEPRFDDDGWDAKLELLAADPPAVVSFTFGCPPRGVVESLHGVGSEVWVTVTSPDEAAEAAAGGADALVVQGAEAGGHRASFTDRPDLPLYALLPLLQLVGATVELPLVATGGIATAAAVAAVLDAGAVAAQVGTAFMLCPEAGTPQVLRDALPTPTATALTRTFTGRLARGIRNRFMVDHEAHAPIAYPEVHHLTASLRAAARESGEGDFVNLWAGEAHQLARPLPAADVVRELAGHI
jgi:nitronate monooxygenase